MKQNNPMFKQFLDQYEHEWFECIAAFSSSIDDLNDINEDEIEYNDIKKIFNRRSAHIRLHLKPSRIQGRESVSEIIDGINYFNTFITFW